MYIYIYIYDIEGDMKNQGEKKTKKQKTTKCQNMKGTHLLGGCLVGAFYCKTEEFLGFLTRAYPPGGVIYVYIYIHTYIHSYIHTYIHTCIHTCIWEPRPNLPTIFGPKPLLPKFDPLKREKLRCKHSCTKISPFL